MKERKTDGANLEKKKGLFFLIGLVVTLSAVLFLVELKQYDRNTLDFGSRDSVEDEDIIPITQRDPTPPPPPPPAPPEIIQIVENEIEIEEIVFESTETDESEEIEIIEEQEEETDEIFNFAVVENKPIFPGCENEVSEDAKYKCFQKGIMKFISKNFEYPEMARQMGDQGKVWVSFVIEKNGKISNVTITRGVTDALDGEAKRLVKLLPKCIPAKQRGKPVRMSYTVPINFKLQ